MIEQLRSQDFRLNLWEHAFVHPESALREPLREHSGDFQVWGGLVPDFCAEPAREIFADLHRREHVALGVSGYKLDECDNSDYTGGWSFPELSTFPSGVDGEQMHSLFGLRYQDAIQSAFDGERTYGLVRSSHALAAPYLYVLYSDLYDHREFVRASANSGFSGLLWTPELRDAASAEDLLRRLQTAVLSPMALINAWYIRNPPWMQVDRESNNAGEFDPDWERLEEQCRRSCSCGCSWCRTCTRHSSATSGREYLRSVPWSSTRPKIRKPGRSTISTSWATHSWSLLLHRRGRAQRLFAGW